MVRSAGWVHLGRAYRLLQCSSGSEARWVSSYRPQASACQTAGQTADGLASPGLARRDALAQRATAAHTQADP